jgi:Ca2+-binding EF-hand superfamily protein
MAQNAKQIQLLEQRFKAANRTGDGKLTREEASAGMPKVARNFDKIDKDHKGYLTLEDIKAAMKVQAK